MMQGKTHAMTSIQTRYISVDIIKGIAMIMVILVHYGQNYNIEIAKVCRYLQMGCPMFFVASGFGIRCLVNNRFKGVLNTENIGRFYYSRFRSLAPGWYIALFVVFLVNTILLFFTGRTLSFGSNRDWISIICNILFLNGLLPFCNNNVMPGGWYIGTTVILYILTPLILKGLSYAKSKRCFFIISSVIGMLFWFGLFFTFQNGFFDNGFGYFFFLVHYPEYLLGIMLYNDISNSILRKEQINRSLFFGIGSYIIAIILFYSGLPYMSIPSAWMTALATYLVLYYMISNEKPNEQKLIGRVLSNIGRHSYYIYLLHCFFAYCFVKLSIIGLEKIGITQTVIFIALIPFTLALSYIAGLVFHRIVNKINAFIFKEKRNKL